MRFGVAVPLMLVAGAVVVDVLRFVAQVPAVGWLNLAVAWLRPHQLGYFYADQSLREESRRIALVLFPYRTVGVARSHEHRCLSAKYRWGSRE
jgi:hypothetical protein